MESVQNLTSWLFISLVIALVRLPNSVSGAVYPRSCADVIYCDKVTTNGMYEIDPSNVGSTGKVYCDLSDPYTTTIRHTNENRKFMCGSFFANMSSYLTTQIEYPGFTYDQVRSFVANSSECYYSLHVERRYNDITLWQWTAYDLSRVQFQQYLPEICPQGCQSVPCEPPFYTGFESSEELSLTQVETFPIRSFTMLDVATLGEKAGYILGPLKCQRNMTSYCKPECSVSPEVGVARVTLFTFKCFAPLQVTNFKYILTPGTVLDEGGSTSMPQLIFDEPTWPTLSHILEVMIELSNSEGFMENRTVKFEVYSVHTFPTPVFDALMDSLQLVENLLGDLSAKTPALMDLLLELLDAIDQGVIVLEIDQSQQFYQSLIEGMVVLNSTDLQVRNKTAQTMEFVSAQVAILDGETQVKLANGIDNLGTNFKTVMTGSVAGDADSEENRNIGLSILRGITNIFVHVHSEVSNTDTAYLEETTPGQVLKEKNKQVATITYSTLDHVSDGFLYQLNPDGEQVHVNLEGVSLSLLKVNQSEGIPLFLQPGGANGTNNGWFNLTDASSELNATIQSHLSAAGLPPNTNIGIKTYSSPENALSWNNASNELNAAVIGLELTLPTSETIPVNDINFPIQMALRTFTQTPLATIGNLRLLTPVHTEPDILFFRFTITDGQTFFITANLSRTDINLTLAISMNKRPDVNQLYDKNDIDIWSLNTQEGGGSEYTIVQETSIYSMVESVASESNHVIIYGRAAFGGTVYVGFMSDTVVNFTWSQNNTKENLQIICETFIGACIYWDQSTETWRTDGCEVQSESTPSQLACGCSHLSKFSATFLVTPNKVDLIGDFKLFSTFFSNPLMVVMVVIVWVLYILMSVWARREDRKDQIKLGVVVLEDNLEDCFYGYSVMVQTGWRAEAGTSSNVYMYITGSRKNSVVHHLYDPYNRRFDTGAEDYFLLTTDKCLGDLHKIHIWQDCSGTFPSWFLTQVVIKDLQEGVEWYFVCNDWLNPHEDQNSIYRELSASKIDTDHTFAYVFNAQASKGFRDDHLWVSILARPPQSFFTRTQRLFCALSFLITSMLANLMFYGRTEDPNKQLGVGEFNLSYTQIIIGVESALITIPINMLLIWIFRSVKPRPAKKYHHSLSGGATDQESQPSVFLSQVDDDPSKIAKDGQNKSQIGTDHKENRGQKLIRFLLGKFTRHKGKEVGVASSIDVQSSQSTVFDSPYDTEEEENAKYDGKKSQKLRDVNGTTDEILQKKSSTDFLSIISSFLSVDNYPPEIDERYKKKKKTPFRLPWWFVYVAWAIGLLANLFCSYVIMLYGLRFGYDKSLGWFISFFVTFGQSACVFQPLKVFILSAILAFLFKKPVEPMQADVLQEGNTEPENDEEYVHDLALGHSKVLKEIEKSEYGLPSLDAIFRAEQRLINERKMKTLLGNLLMNALFLFCLFSLIYGMVHPMRFQSNKAIQDTLIGANYDGEIPLDEVTDVDSLWLYVEKSFLPAVYHHVYQEVDAVFAADLVNVMIGVPRIRQHRVVKGATCKMTHLMSALSGKNCYQTFSSSHLDKGSYGPGWTSIEGQDDNNLPEKSAWVYQSSESLGTAAVLGAHATYPGGGFADTLGRGRTYAQRKITTLKNSGWIDQYTRAIQVEVNFYNPNVNLFNVVMIMFEFLSTGEIVPFHHILTTQLYYKTASEAVSALLLEMIYAIFVLAAIIREITNFIRMRKNCQYFKRFESYLALATIGFALGSVVAFGKRYMAVHAMSKDLAASRGETHVSLYYAALWDYTLVYLMAALQLLALMKIGQLLQFHRRLMILTAILKKAVPVITAFMGILLCACVSYVLVGMLLLGSNCEVFSTAGNSVMMILSLAMLELDFEKETSCATSVVANVIGPFYVVFVGMIVAGIWIPLLQAVLDYQTLIMWRVDVELKGELELFNFMYERIYYSLGLKKKDKEKVVKSRSDKKSRN